MKTFLTLIFVAFLGTFNMNSQTSIEINPIISEVVLSIDSAEQIAAKKRDILNARINSKLKGEIDLFFIADKSKRC
ncbi:hypothetical protein [Bizionia arctica]|uniref:Uncharacterized protein n=1 Tax=Bizionia arctica TaxID=1495645 RepID=A0A917LUE3_9FLAO|nr:hypothetical protein [Bizionia arctica]GGG57547.1 hypothetical protein GCM10010976_30510 [Bizionia arctica]